MWLRVALLLGALVALALLLRQESTALQLPAIGVGTKSGSTLDNIAAAISAGFTLLDTKDTNLSLEALGAAIHASKLPRDAFFVVSKLVGERDPAAHAPAGVEAAMRAALGRAKLARWDCYMIHVTHSFGGTPVLATYRALEHLVDAGLTRTVGLSNVRADQLEFLLREARIPPAVVEQEVHPYNQERRRRSAARVASRCSRTRRSAAHCARGCSPSRRSSKSRGGAASIAAVLLRWHVQRGVIDPSSRHLAHLRANFAAAAARCRRPAAVARLDRRERGWPKPTGGCEYRHDVILQIGERSAPFRVTACSSASTPGAGATSGATCGRR